VDIHPVTLEGRIVRLEPLSLDHLDDLAAAGQDETIWTFMLYGRPTTPAGMRAWIEDILARQARGGDLAFAVVLREVGRAVGSTRYLDIRREHRGLEIGGTWYAPACQGTLVNPECKYLLLRHAFENLGCLRVQFKTDLRNHRSQRAIERLGAVREGVLRDHMITPDGVVRSSVMYSILRGEWPAVKGRLESRLG
jgi:N-acetyltransferase